MNIGDIAKNGIVGAGGGGFPTHVKLSSKPEFVIANAAECEPLIHKDKEILLNHMDKVLDGLRTAMDITGAGQGIIGIKQKQGGIISRLSAATGDNLHIVLVGDFYPAGDEATLVYLTTGRVIHPGELPISAGCVVQNIETLYNIAVAKPVTDKFLTVAGAIEEPLTIKVPVGTPFNEVLSHFKINTRSAALRSGGLMMGKIEEDWNQVVTKQTGGLVVLPSDHYCMETYYRYSEAKNTIRMARAGCDQCSFCTDLCPRYLLGYPVRPETAMRNRIFSGNGHDSFHTGNEFCCECNLCTFYSCPEGLDPKGATVIEKQNALKSNAGWEGLPIRPHPLIDYRRVPTKKLMQRLDVLRYDKEAPLKELNIEPAFVRIPLKQHAGAPARPVVGKGRKVEKYDLIAEADGEISANIHASISGAVIDANKDEIIIMRPS